MAFNATPRTASPCSRHAVVHGLERFASVPAKEFVGEDLSYPRHRARAPPVPVLVGERADPGLDARAVRELEDVLGEPERPKNEDPRGPVNPGVFGDRGAPAGDSFNGGTVTGKRRTTREHGARLG